jgi:hypothetical protein
VVALSAGSFFVDLGEGNFNDIRKESRRAQIAQEMVEDGHWVVPRLNGEVILIRDYDKLGTREWPVVLSNPISDVTFRSGYALVSNKADVKLR